MFEGIFGTRRELDRTRAETQFSAVVEVEAYWQALRENHHVPKRSDLDPRGIRGALSKAFILDCSSYGDPRFRIVGSDLAELHKRDLRGLPLTEMIAPAKRKTVRELLQDVTRLPATAQLDFSAETANGTQIDLRAILLPMDDTNGRLTRILGCLDFEHAALAHRSCSDLQLSGSIVRPLGRERQAIVRRMQHRGLKVVSSSDRVKTVPRSRRAKPALTLVTP